MRYNRRPAETVELTRGFDQQVDEMTVTTTARRSTSRRGRKRKLAIYTVPVEPDFRSTHRNQVKIMNRRSKEYTFVSGLNVSDGRTNNSIHLELRSRRRPELIVSIGTEPASRQSFE